jgi:transcriptional regulator with XRE-family HTH domain
MLPDLRILREQLGLTQLELASLLKVHQSTISKIEGGRTDLGDDDFWQSVQLLQSCWTEALAVAQRGATIMFRLRVD